MLEPVEREPMSVPEAHKAGVTLDDGWWAMAMVDPQGMVLEANAPFAELFSTTTEVLTGRPIFDWLPRDALSEELAGRNQLVVATPRSRR